MRACARESIRERACDKTFLKRKKMYGKEIGSERTSNQKTEKIRLLFSRERERERESFRGFSAAVAQREAFEIALCVWSFQVNARSRVKKLFALPREGFFSL